jgi:signal transduction histidine kinase/CheY-like chemotaxis protein/ligand-binding sensor domain-containing protein
MAELYSSPARCVRKCARPFVRVALALLLCVACTGGTPAAPPEQASAPDVLEFGRPAITIYNDEDGLPENAVQAIAFDRDGYLWVGTQDGAARYNGRSWTVVDMPNRSISNNVLSLTPARGGGMWFGTRGSGLALYRDGAWTVFDTRNGLPHDNVRALLETSGGGRTTLWAGTEAGLARVEDGVVTSAGPGCPAKSVVSLEATETESDSPVVWAGGGDGLMFLRGGVWASVRSLDPKKPSPKGLSLLAVSSGGNSREVWVGTQVGLARVDPDHGTFAFESPLADAPTWDLAQTTSPSGAQVLWAVVDPGLLYRIEGGVEKRIGGRSGVARNPIHTLRGAPPSAGASMLLVGTDGDGLVRLDEGQWATLDATSGGSTGGLPHDVVRAIFETRSPAGESTFWFGTNGGGIGRYVQRGKGEWTTFDTSSGLPTDIVNCFAEGPSPSGGKTVWVGGVGGLSYFEGDRIRQPASGSGAPYGTVAEIIVSKSDSGAPVMWVATSQGLSRFESGRWSPVATPKQTEGGGFPSGPILSILETVDSAGARTLWAASFGGGVGRLDGARWTRFGAEHGIVSNQTVALGKSRTASGAQTLWVGTQSGGVSLLRLDVPGAAWVTISDETTPALPNNTIYRIVDDDEGGVYVFTNRGCTRLTPRVAEPTAASDYDVVTYTTTEGLPSNEFNFGAGFKDSRGRVWGGTVRGVVAIDPTRGVADLAAKTLRIERSTVQARETHRALAAGESLAHDENSVEFEFALLSFRGEAGTRYRTELVGLDSGPTNWTVQPRRAFPYLPQGDYVFRVWGRDAAGNVSGPVEVSFTVRPAPWLTAWAFLLYGLGALALAYLAVRMRLRALQGRNQLLTEKIAERTAELSDTVARLGASERRAVEAKEEALDASRVKSVFLANVSHELRTPLHAILGFVSLMERRKSLDEEDREHLGVVRRSSEHLLGLLNEILSISKIEAGRVPLATRDFDTRQLLRGLEDMFRVRAHSKCLQLIFEVAPVLPRHARGDDGKLRQVLINLLSNAINYTDAGEVRLTVWWRKGRARFEVIDTGRGVAREELGDLFKPFVQTESGRTAAGGTGLGLAISRQLVELMGGEISVQSEPGLGSTFAFEIPLQAAPGKAGDVEPLRVVGLDAGEPSCRALVVDDKEENRTYLAGLLSQIGFEVQEASNGEDAVAMSTVWHPDLVLMDLRMPGMDGYEAARRIRAREAELRGPLSSVPRPLPEGAEGEGRGTADKGQRTRIIALSANVLGHDGGAIVAAGCDDFLAKPFREEELFERIAALLGVRFHYEHPSAAQTSATPTAPEGGPLSPERLAALAPALLEDLRRAAMTGNLTLAYQTVEAARRSDAPLAEALRGLVKGYRFDELRDLIEIACQKPTTPGR